MNIVQKTSTVHTSRYANRPIEYLVIHYTAGSTSRQGTARNVAAMFGNPANRDASADFIVDDAECVQYNGDIRNRYTYAVGGGLQGNSGGGKFYGKCKNFNSISIEICSSSTNNDLRYPNTSNWYFTDASLNNAVELARHLMDVYNIPDDHLIRHYDVNQKLCPGIIGWNKESGSEAKWIDFKNRVLNGSATPTEEDEDMTLEKFTELMNQYRATLRDNDCGDWSKEAREWAIANGLFEGSGTLADGSPNYMWADMLTREQAAALFYRFAQKNGLA